MTVMTSRKWAIIFFISLALNVFLVGAFVAGKYFHNQGRGFRGMVYSVPWAVRVIDDDGLKVKARDLFRQRRQDFRRNRESLRNSYNEVNATLTAEPFNQEAFVAALAKLRDTGTSTRVSIHQSLADFTAGLTLEQRQKLVAAVKNRAERRAHRRQRRRERQQSR